MLCTALWLVKSEIRSEKRLIYKLKDITLKIKIGGYRTESRVVLRDVHDEEKVRCGV